MVSALTCDRSTNIPRRFISADHFLAERRQAPVQRNVGRRVRPVVGAEVGQRHVADTQFVEHPERRGGALDRVPALEADHRSDPSGGVRPLDVVRGEGELEVLVAVHEPVDDVDLADRLPERVPGGDEVRVHEGRPELHSDPTLAEPRDVGGKFHLYLAQIRAGSVEIAADHVEQRTRQVVVPVGEGNAAQQLAGAIHEFRSDPGREWLRAGAGADSERGKECEKAVERQGSPFPGGSETLMYILMIMKAQETHRRSVAEARRNLPRLIRAAEDGRTVEITPPRRARRRVGQQSALRPARAEAARLHGGVPGLRSEHGHHARPGPRRDLCRRARSLTGTRLPVVTPRYLLDSDVVSEPTRPAPSAKVLDWLERHEGESAIAAPVWHELRFGCERLPPSRRRNSIESYLAGSRASEPADLRLRPESRGMACP